jgi:hypothetical protein
VIHGARSPPVIQVIIRTGGSGEGGAPQVDAQMSEAGRLSGVDLFIITANAHHGDGRK